MAERHPLIMTSYLVTIVTDHQTCNKIRVNKTATENVKMHDRLRQKNNSEVVRMASTLPFSSEG